VRINVRLFQYLIWSRIFSATAELPVDIGRNWRSGSSTVRTRYFRDWTALLLPAAESYVNLQINVDRSIHMSTSSDSFLRLTRQSVA